MCIKCRNEAICSSSFLSGPYGSSSTFCVRKICSRRPKSGGWPASANRAITKAFHQPAAPHSDPRIRTRVAAQDPEPRAMNAPRAPAGTALLRIVKVHGSERRYGAFPVRCWFRTMPTLHDTHSVRCRSHTMLHPHSAKPARQRSVMQ